MKILICILLFIFQHVLTNTSPIYPIYANQNRYGIGSMQQKEKECLIMSDEYGNGYLYSSSFPKPWFRSVFVWDPIFNTRKMPEFTDSDESGVWIFEPVANRQNTYLIRNAKYGEYLHPSHFISKKQVRRNIYTSKYTEGIDHGTQFMWYFKKLPNGLYEIWNVKFYER